MQDGAQTLLQSPARRQQPPAAAGSPGQQRREPEQRAPQPSPLKPPRADSPDPVVDGPAELSEAANFAQAALGARRAPTHATHHTGSSCELNLRELPPCHHRSEAHNLHSQRDRPGGRPGLGRSVPAGGRAPENCDCSSVDARSHPPIIGGGGGGKGRATAAAAVSNDEAQQAQARRVSGA